MPKPIPHRERFPHRKLEVYHVASEFYVLCWRFCERLHYSNQFVRSQLLRAALSIKLNIAEAASEVSPKEKARLYRLAKRSAGECAALLDDFPKTIGTAEKELEPFYMLLVRIANMLTKLCISMESIPPRKSKKRKN